MPIAVIYIAAGILFVGAAQLHLPYGYYTVLRIVATGAFLWAFFASFNRNASLLPWIFLLFAVLFNPVMKVPLSQEHWMIVDIAAGALLIFTQNKIKQQATTKIV
jgi:hypothetical protein